jgi:hypothetical protein
MKPNTLSATKIIFTTMVLVAFFYGLNSCDRGDLCYRGAPEVILIENFDLRAPDSEMVWVYKTRNGKPDTHEITISSVDTIFKVYDYRELEENCYYSSYGTCTIYNEEVEYTYKGSDYFKLKKWKSRLSCPIKFDLVLGSYSNDFSLDEFYLEKQTYNSYDVNYVVHRDSGLIYFKLKETGESIKRIK